MQLMHLPSRPLRPGPATPWKGRGMSGLAVLLLTTGCGAGEDNAHRPETPTAVVSSSARPDTPTAVATSGEPAGDAEPTPSFSQDGATRVLFYGNLTVSATPEADGVRTTVTVRNDTEDSANYYIEISVGNGVDWVGTNTYRLTDVPAHGSDSQTSTIGGVHLGPIPQHPKIYVDRMEQY
ncbi:hypothetical protein [Streptomyces sp. 1-11]|uniref:hypothetical protein n=1 Tax=Streptomyces sp. 1-11 TaxID=2590549 RepID=UPI00117DE1A8|nr:hypothetical protein [Streptomyces sp. 1-11]